MVRPTSPAINHNVGGWNQNPTWEHFSALVQSTTDGVAAPNRTVRHRHVKTALYSAIGAIESFLNATMRSHLDAEGVDEKSIHDRLRKTSFALKLKKWPAELAGKDPSTPTTVIETTFAWQKLRDEVTHPKGDQSLYKQLAAVSLDTMRSTIAEIIVRIMAARGEIYPYWLLGWNFVNGPSADEPLLIANQQFLFAMSRLGFDIAVPSIAPMEQWEQHFMTSLDGYRALDEALQRIGYCEPRDSRFRRAPRLCRKWWDSSHSKACGGQEAQAEERSRAC